MLEFIVCRKRLKPDQKITLSFTPEEVAVLAALVGAGYGSDGLYRKLWSALSPTLQSDIVRKIQTEGEIKGWTGMSSIPVTKIIEENYRD